jgi:hypothetical protein
LTKKILYRKRDDGRPESRANAAKVRG